MGDPNFEAVVMSEVNSFSQATATNRFEPRLTNANEVGLALRGLKNKKSVGPDAIPNVVSKKLSGSVHGFIAKLINCVLSMGYYPSCLLFKGRAQDGEFVKQPNFFTINSEFIHL